MRRLLTISFVLLCTAGTPRAALISIESPQAECALCGPLCGGPCQLYYNSSLPVIEINVWVSPDPEGAFGASLTVEFPPNVLVISVTTNPLVCSITGDLFDGTSFLLTECQPASFWSHRLYCMIIDSSQGFIYLNPHPADGLTVRRCDTGLPVASLGTGIWLGLNHSYGTEETSWGAIKSMYGD